MTISRCLLAPPRSRATVSHDFPGPGFCAACCTVVDWAKICAHVQPHTFVISSPWSSTNLESLGKLGFTLIVIKMATTTTSAHAAALTAVAGGATLTTISAATLALGAQIR